MAFGTHYTQVKRPNLFIVGAPRCGTGSLWTYLRRHPEIFMSEEKELYFFDSDLREKPGPSLGEYLRHFAGADGQKWVGEATPSYLRSRAAPAAIRQFSPEARIVIMLRNPVDVMHSLHNAALYRREPITDFAAALDADARRNGRDRIGYREFTDFPEQVQRYFDVFGREQVHVIIYEDLRLDAAAVGRNTLCFLEVRNDIAWEFPWVHANKQVRSPRLEKMLSRPPNALLRMARVLAPRQLRSRMRWGLLRSNAAVAPRSQIQPELRRRLQLEMQPKIQQLGKLLNRDLTAWCRD
ncbi:MAG: sulfotransferase family protein [Chlamydiota bacterium]